MQGCEHYQGGSELFRHGLGGCVCLYHAAAGKLSPNLGDPRDGVQASVLHRGMADLGTRSSTPDGASKDLPCTSSSLSLCLMKKDPTPARAGPNPPERHKLSTSHISCHSACLRHHTPKRSRALQEHRHRITPPDHLVPGNIHRSEAAQHSLCHVLLPLLAERTQNSQGATHSRVARLVALATTCSHHLVAPPPCAWTRATKQKMPSTSKVPSHSCCLTCHAFNI